MFFRPEDFVLSAIVFHQPIELLANVNQHGAKQSDLWADVLLPEQFLKIFEPRLWRAW